jgi:hypothetical protein
VRQRFAPALVLALASLGACRVEPEERPLTCAPPPGTDRLLARPERFILFGEIHGTNEAPASFGEIVCAAAEKGPVVVGVEWFEEFTPAFNAYLASDGGREARESFVSSLREQFTGDGRSSRAAFALYDRLRDIKVAGADIRIVAFVRLTFGEPAKSQTPYEKALAASLMAGAGDSPRVLVLVGNTHSRRKTFSSTPPFDPMAMHLPKRETLSLSIGHAGGTSHSCRPDCGVQELVPVFPSPVGIEFPAGGVDGGVYDGLWAIGPVTASPPMD